MLRSALGLSSKSWGLESLTRVVTTQRPRCAPFHRGVVIGDVREALANKQNRLAVPRVVRPVGKLVKHMCSSTNHSKPPASPDELARWGLKLNLENTHLSWSRNGIISTIAGVGMFQ